MTFTINWPKHPYNFNNIKGIVEHHYRVQKFITVYFRTLTDSTFSASEVFCPECTRAQKQVLYKLLIWPITELHIMMWKCVTRSLEHIICYDKCRKYTL